jgi:predicted O-methyltransferase YrrM
MGAMPALAELGALAASLASSPDGRPAWLRAMPSASDATALYYRFFHEFSLRYAPAKVLEIGTYVGSSAAHLASNPATTVVTVDHNPDAKRLVDALGRPNVVAVTMDSALFAEILSGSRPPPSSAPPSGPFDVLFVDGNHTFNQAYGEYERFRPHVAEGGLVFFDDIHLPMSTREMDVLWALVPDEKLDLSVLHYTGMGVAKVSRATRLPPWAEAAPRADAMMGR